MTTESLRIETEKFVANTPTSKRLQEEALEYLPGGSSRGTAFFAPYPTFVDHGEGLHVYDVDGNRYLDFMINATSLVLGHAHPDIVAAVTEQMAKGTHHSASTDLEIRWGELVRELVPSAEKVHFHSSGTEADMMAIRMARAYTGKTKIIKFEDHFHGWSDYLVAGSDGIGGIPQEVLSTMIVLPPNDIDAVEKAIQGGDVRISGT